MTQDNINNLTGLSADLQTQIDKLTGQKASVDMAVQTLTVGYQSDQAAIDAAVSDKVSAALSPVQTAITAALPVLNTVVTPQ